MRFEILCILLVLGFGCIGNGSVHAPEQPQPEVVENVSENDTGEQWIDEPVENESTEVNETEEKPIETLDENPPAEEEEDNTPAIGQDGPQRTYFDNGNYALVIDDVVWYGDNECAAVRITDGAGSALKIDVICPRQDYYWTTPEGHRYRFVISEVASGYSTGESWAKVNIYG